MNVVYTFDDGYTEITGVSIVSLLENNKNEESINIFIVDCGISDTSKRKIEKICHDYNRSLSFLTALDLNRRIGFTPKSHMWSTVCYERLFYAEILPSFVDRVLHIDCDTIIRGRIGEIYNWNLDEAYLGACYDCTPKPKRQAGLSARSPYISNGLMLINLTRWRNCEIGDRFVEYINNNPDSLPHLDQDVINGVIGKEVSILPANCNMMPITLMYGPLCVGLFKSNQPYYSKLEIAHAVKNPLIIHFTGFIYTRRPWEQPCNHWYNNEWIQYYRLLDYSKTNSCLRQKRRRFLFAKQAFDKCMIILARVPLINKIIFYMDCKFIYKINE